MRNIHEGGRLGQNVLQSFAKIQFIHQDGCHVRQALQQIFLIGDLLSGLRFFQRDGSQSAELAQYFLVFRGNAMDFITPVGSQSPFDFSIHQ